MPRTQRHADAARAFDNNAIGARGDQLISIADAHEVDRNARLDGSEMRRDRRRERKWIARVERSIDVARRRERGNVGVARGARRDSRRDRFHADRAQAARGVRAQQRTGEHRLADAGVGAGDEYAAGRVEGARGGFHRAARGAKRTIARPSAATRGSGFHA